MSTCLQNLVLVAAGDRTRQVMQAFRTTKSDTPPEVAWFALILAAASLLVLMAVTFFVQAYLRRRNASPRGLFLELCRAHRLRWPQRRLLWQLAESQKLADPATVFLDPACFEVGRLTVEIRPHAMELRQLCERLFADAVEKKNTPSAAIAFRETEQPTAELPLSPIPPTLELPQWTGSAETGIFD
jgi:hypothetical protein